MSKHLSINIGDRFGRLTIIEQAEPFFYDYFTKKGKPCKYKFTRWLCKCDCGNEITTPQNSLRKKRSISCGCAKGIGKSNSQWNGYGDISGKQWYKIKKNAIRKKRTLEFTITIQEAVDLFIKQNKKCALTGLPLHFPSKGDLSDGTASLDRIDSLKGYITGNVRWVFKTVNVMKWNETDENFIMFCRLVSAYNPHALKIN